MKKEISELKSYADVFALNEVELRMLLVEGDEPVQVWASWALGIKLKATITPPEIQSLMCEEPTPGVRQNLLVFLVGNGNHDLLEKYARADPSSNVRAAACNLLSRVAENIHEKNMLHQAMWW